MKSKFIIFVVKLNFLYSKNSPYFLIIETKKNKSNAFKLKFEIFERNYEKRQI